MLLLLAAVAAVVVVPCYAFGRSIVLKALELPAQSAASLSMLACVARYREVDASARLAVPERAGANAS